MSLLLRRRAAAMIVVPARSPGGVVQKNRVYAFNNPAEERQKSFTRRRNLALLLGIIQI